ncbi:hypothetical protein TRICI_004409 [Trichomonascus ciferrii]|uniref:Gluconokinase n=1 Tax=Trichomonascus ciferrii TaxID=44093 RepID=A0A642V0D6_9ASCO|nr:hypothetical protein TRICI_004409 [Trichomonascus ciferrii]
MISVVRCPGRLEKSGGHFAGKDLYGVVEFTFDLQNIMAMYTSSEPLAIIVGGPAGTGKTTVGEGLAEKLDASYIEGDSLHPPANIEKMSNGIPLTDDDRWDWLTDVAKTVSSRAKGVSVGSCSALTKKYRAHLREHAGNTKFIVVFLWAEKDELHRRVSGRKGHYMGANMVQSQYDLMQVPQSDEADFCIPLLTDAPPEELIGRVLTDLEERKLISKR